MDRFGASATRPQLETSDVLLPVVKQEGATAPQEQKYPTKTRDKEFDATYVDLTKPQPDPLNIVYLQIAYSTTPTKVILRFARALSAALGKRIEEIYSHERMHYLMHTVCKAKVDDLDTLLVSSLDTLYQFLFSGVHYIIERTLFRISEYIGNSTTLYQVVGDERSMSVFVQLCSSNQHRLKLEGGIKFSNNVALQMGDVAFSQGLSRMESITSITVDCDTDDESFDFQPRESNEHLALIYDLCTTVSEWSMVLLLHQAMLKTFDERRVQKSMVINPSSWSSWMNPFITDAIHQAWFNNNGTQSMASTLRAMAASRSHCVLFANLVGVCYHLKQFEQQMYKRTPVVTLLLRTQRELLELLHA